MMQCLGCWRVLIGRGDGLVSHEVLHQPLEPGILKASPRTRPACATAGRCPSMFSADSRSDRFRSRQLAHFVEVSCQRPLYFCTVPLTLTKSSCSNAFSASATLSHMLACTWPVRSAMRERQVRLAVLLGLYLLGSDHEIRSYGLIFVLLAVAEIEVFHGGPRGVSLDERP